MKNLGLSVARLNALSRELQIASADSFAPKRAIYQIAVDIAMEANQVRQMMGEENERRSPVCVFLNWFGNLLGFRRL
jgi:hypothetical protein